MGQKAKVEAAEAEQAAEDYAYAQRAEFVAKMKAELAKAQDELARLSAKVEKSAGEVKADAEVRLEQVRAKVAQAKKELDKAESATESTWEDFKGGVKRAYGDMQDSFDDAREWLSDKIAP